MVTDSGCCARLETPRALPEPAETSLARPPAKENVLARVGMLSTARDPAHDDCPPCCSPAAGPLLRRPPLSWDGHCKQRTRAFVSTLYCWCLTLTRQAPRMARFGLDERAF
jgi:hypothetical protein